MIDKSMLSDFIVEAVEHLEEMENNLLHLEQNREDTKLLNEIFRAVHSIKGAAQFVCIDKIAELSHKLENLLDLVRAGEKPLDENLIDLLMEAKDRITLLVGELEKHQREDSEIDDLLARILQTAEEPQPEEKPEELQASPPVEEGIIETDLAETLQQALEEQVPAPSQPEAAPALPHLVNETVNEQSDPELLEIFLQKLYNDIKSFKRLIATIDTAAAPLDVLDQIQAVLQSQCFSANYMGYDSLYQFYLGWKTAINTAMTTLRQGDAVDLGFLNTYLKKLLQTYPDAEKDHDEETAVIAPDMDTSGMEALESLFGEDSPEELFATSSDAFETIGGPASSLPDETTDEEYDQELLDIFMQKLKDDAAILHQQTAELELTLNQPDTLDRCRETINNLRSSSNYMGYDGLNHHFDSWISKIEHAKQMIVAGNKTDLDFMKSYLEELIKAYPDIAEKRDQGIEEPTPSEGTETGASLADTELPFQPQATESSPEQPEPDSIGEELFSKLNSALDTSLSLGNDVPDKPLHNVIETIISDTAETSNAPSEPVAAKTEEPVSEVTSQDSEEKQAAPEMTAVGAITSDTSAPEGQDRLQEETEIDRQQEEKRPDERQKSEDSSKATIKRSMRVDTDKIDYLINQVGELVVSRAYFNQLLNEIANLQQEMMDRFGLTKTELKQLQEFSYKLSEASIALGRVSNEIQEAVMKVRMLPISQLFNRYPRLVRDLVHKSDKKVNLVIRGEETELDKMVIEEISDPLIHILRNAVDHGIESTTERKRVDKPETATILLEAYHESNHIVIEITDDGRGIDPKRVQEAALKRGLYSSDDMDRMTHVDLMRVVLMPGFSTSEKATETSGRGVGMDVVRKNIEKLNGTIDIGSIVGKQTQIRIKIPLTLAIIQALLVRVDNETFTIPLTAVQETLRIFDQEISEIEGVEVIHLRDSTLPIFRLSRLFGHVLPPETDENAQLSVVVVSTGLQEIGLVVDKLLGQEEVVIKPLVDYLRGGNGFSGATIIGDGAISLILDIPEIVNMTSERQIFRQKELMQKRKRSGANQSEKQLQ